MTEHEEWHKVHAQLLKSVADAQARLLAGINDIADAATHINGFLMGWQGRVDAQDNAIREKLEVLGQRLTVLTVSAAALNGNHSGLKGQLDAIGAILAELLTVRRPVAKPMKRAKRRR